MTLFDNNDVLLQMFRRGDSRSLAKVYLYYANTVKNHVARSAIYPEAQQDLLQEIFERAFTQKARLAYDNSRRYRPYLLKIANNTLIDFWRKRSRDPLDKAMMNTEGSELNDIEGGILDIIAQEKRWENERKRQKLIHSCTRWRNGLDPAWKKFVSLRFEQQLTQRKIAEILNVTRWNVRSTEQKLLEDVASYLKKNVL